MGASTVAPPSSVLCHRHHLLVRPAIPGHPPRPARSAGPQLAVQPPSMAIDAPVMNEAAGEQR